MYFDACFEGDGDKMDQVLHQAAHVYGHAPDGSLADMPKNDFIKLVRSMPDDAPPFPREDEIISIDFSGENTAVVRVRLRIFNTRFTDILSFMRLEGKWGVIAKLYSGVTVE